MKKELKIIWAAMASLILVAAVCAIPPTLPHSTATHEQTAAPTQSVSGKIAEVQKTFAGRGERRRDLSRRRRQVRGDQRARFLMD